MNKQEDYGRCEACDAVLTARYHSFERLVERFSYDQPGETPDDQATITVLRCDLLGLYCGQACAMPAVLLGLAERGLRPTDCGAGPIEVCAKCGGPMDLTKPHVAYQLMDQTETRQPWLASIEPHDTDTLAYVCPRCDGDLSADEMNVPEAVDEDMPVAVSVVS